MASRAKSLATLGTALVLALLALDGAAHGQAYQSSGSTNPFGSVTIDNSVANTTTVTVNTNRATINWTPSDNPSSSAPFTFLPAGTTANYAGGAALSGAPYTVLNRIIPNSAKPIQFDGTVNSDAAGHIWFYTPGGMIIGSTARFNVGSLLLTTGDPVLDVNSNFMPVNGHFQLADVAGSQSAIVIQSGAQLNAINAGQSNYIVALAPRIQQDGAISVRGSAALVAAEGATFAIDATGLFTISVDAFNQGTTVTSTDALSHSGSTGGPDSGSVGSARRVYLMAVPKNSAITMAIQSGGSLGFAIAGAANVSGNAIVLSGGRSITDTGTGNPITGPSLINQLVTINIARGNYTSGVWAGSNDTINIADAVAGGTPDIKFAGQLFASGNTVNMNLTQGTNTVGGKLTLDVTGDLVRAPGTATLTLDGASTRLTVSTGIDLLARNGQLGTGSTSSAAYYDNGGNTSIGVSNGAVLSASGNIRAISNALGQTSGASPASGPSIGGTATVTVSGGGQIISTAGSVIVLANAFGLTAPGAASTSPAINAQGGYSQVAVGGANSLISAATGLLIQAGGTGGNDTVTGTGGNGTGGNASLSAIFGGRVVGGASISVTANGIGGNGGASGGRGGDGTAGTAQVTASDGVIADGTSAGFATTAVLVEAGGQGGNGTVLGPGGSATGGNALLQTSGMSGMMDAGGGFTVSADATSGTSAGGPGGAATGGTASFGTTGPGQAIGSVVAGPIVVSAPAVLGATNGGIAGDANGGTAQLGSSGGGISATTLSLNAAATGDATAHNSGATQSGTVVLGVNYGGSITATAAATFSAAATSSAETDPNNGNVAAGRIVINNAGGTLHLAGTTSFDAGVTVGMGANGSATPADFYTGTAMVRSAPGTATAFGTGATGGGNIDIAQTTLVGAADYTFAAANNINLATTAFFGAAASTNLALRADSGGTGTGTVFFANGAVNLTGAGSTTSFFYNPAAFGTPTDFSPAVTASSWTGYQLVNSLADLQNINSFLTQNFALGKSLDASATIGWNGGAGFIPLGTDAAGAVLNSGAGFTGQLHGLGNVISGLVVNRPSTYYSGLVGYLGAAGSVSHIGLDGGSMNAAFYVGGLVGQAYGAINRTFANVAISGGGDVGGLVGRLETGGSISKSFATGAVSGGSTIGGLVGISDGTITAAYASGHVTGTSYVGGLVGANNSTLNRVYATGDVNGQNFVGGITGANGGSINESYASGAVISTGVAGGVAGDSLGTITNSYWDTFTTMQASAISTGTGTLTNVLAVTSDPAQSAAANWAFSPTSYANFNGVNWYSFNNATRPVGLWELRNNRLLGGTVESIHELEALSLRLGQDFTLGANIDASETGRLAGIWGSSGFIPIGTGSAQVANVAVPYSGSFDGAGHVIAGLTIAHGGSDLGLFASLAGTVRNLGLVNVNIGTGSQRAGAIAGTNNGLIQYSFSTGTVSANFTAGGLVGENGLGGTISNSYSSATVNGVAIDGLPSVGGLVGYNFGKIDFAYANGAVGGGINGGLVGSNDSRATITNSYWDTQLAGQGSACGVDVGTLCSAATGLSTLQTQFATNYAGWSLDNAGGQGQTWRIYDGLTTPLLKVFLRPLVVDAASTSLTYDGTVPQVYAPAPVGADPSHLLGLGLTSGAGRNVGTYSLTYAGGYYSDQQGYDIVGGAQASLTINPAALLLAASGDSRGYDTTTGSAASVGVTGLQRGDTVTGLAQSFDSPNAGGRTLSVNPGYIVNDGNGGLNYTVTIHSSEGSITPAPLSLDAVADSKTYNASPASSLTPLVTGLQGNDSVGSLSQSFDSANAGDRTLSVNPGYSINDGNGGLNYSVTTNVASGVINPAQLTLSAVNDSRLYTGTSLSAGTPTVTGLQGNDSVGALSQSFDSPNAGARTLAVDAGYAVNDGNGGLNYAVSLVGASGSIVPAPLSITAGNATRTYNTLPFSGGTGVTYAGFVNGESASVLGGTLSYGGTAQGAANAGSYAITPGGLTASNYAITFVDGALTITPASLTFSALVDSRTYTGTTTSTFTPLVNGLQGNDNVTGLSQAFDSANAGPRTLLVNPGYTIHDGNSGANYTVNTLSAFGVISPAPLTVTAANAAITYNAAAFSGGNGVSYTGFVNGETAAVLGGTLGYTGTSQGARNVGSYVITPGGLNALNYSLSYANGTLTINPALLQLTALSDSRTYTGTTASAQTPTTAGLQGSDTVSGLTQSFNVPNAGSRTLAVNAGYTINDGNGGLNYSVSLVASGGSIVPAPLTIAANSGTRVYNGFISPSANGATYSGFVNGEGPTNLTGVVGFTGTITSARNVGTYTIIPGGPTSNNYAITFVNGSETVTPAPLTLSAAPDSKGYNASAASVGVPTATGLLGGDTVGGLAQAFDSANAGPRTLAVTPGYAINDSNGGANYAVVLVGAPGAITPASATVTYTANRASSTYGNLPTGLTGSVGVTPLFGNDSLATITSGAAAFTTPAGATSAVGSYAINGGGLAATTGNYTISFAQAPGNATALSIIPRALVVTGDALSRSYGNANPALTFTVGGQGLVNGDALSGALTTPATVTSGIGSYPLSQGSLAASGNYTLTYQPGTLAITPRLLTVTADSFSRAYGDANPTLTYTVGGQGLANGDQLAGALATTAAVTSGVGSYAVTQGNVAASANYALTFVPGAITVTARPLTITATALSRFTTDPNPALTYTVGGRGLVNGDTLSGALATSATAASPPSGYPITQGTLAATSNYAVSYVPGTLTVNACVFSAGCSADVSAQVTQQIAPAVQPPPVSPAAQTPQQQQQEEQQQQQEKKESAKADNSGKPQIVTQTLVNTGGLNIPPPVNEPVTGTGNFNVDFQSATGGPQGAPQQ